MPTINRSNKVREPKQIYKHNRQSEKYYNTLQWKNLRNSYIKEHPFCQKCLEEGRVTLAEEVHHITTILSAPEEFRYAVLTDDQNLVSLCKKCHSEVHTTNNKDYLKSFDDWYFKHNNPGDDQQKVK